MVEITVGKWYYTAICNCNNKLIMMITVKISLLIHFAKQLTSYSVGWHLCFKYRLVTTLIQCVKYKIILEFSICEMIQIHIYYIMTHVIYYFIYYLILSYFILAYIIHVLYYDYMYILWHIYTI